MKSILWRSINFKCVLRKVHENDVKEHSALLVYIRKYKIYETTKQKTYCFSEAFSKAIEWPLITESDRSDFRPSDFPI